MKYKISLLSEVIFNLGAYVFLLIYVIIPGIVLNPMDTYPFNSRIKIFGIAFVICALCLVVSIECDDENQNRKSRIWDISDIISKIISIITIVLITIGVFRHGIFFAIAYLAIIPGYNIFSSIYNLFLECKYSTPDIDFKGMTDNEVASEITTLFPDSAKYIKKEYLNN